MTELAEYERQWDCPMCSVVYKVSERLIRERGDVYASKALNYYRDQHISEHCEELAEELDMAGL